MNVLQNSNNLLRILFIDYDNQQPSPSPDNRFRNIEGSQTVSAGILRNQRPLPSPGATERKSGKIKVK